MLTAHTQTTIDNIMVAQRMFLSSKFYISFITSRTQFYLLKLI